MAKVAERARARRVPAATEWRSWNNEDRLPDTVFVDTRDGFGLTGRRVPFRVPLGPDRQLRALDLLANLPPGTRRVFLTGPRAGDGTPDGARLWALAADLPFGWVPGRTGHYLDDPEFPVCRWRSPEGFEVDVRRMACWLDGDPNPFLAQAAMEAFDRHMRGAFNYGDDPIFGPGQAATWGSPGGFGTRVWRSQLSHGQSYAVLSKDHQTLIRATTTQGRVEPTNGPRRPHERPGVTRILDRRLAYWAHVHNVAHGPAELVQAEDLPLSFNQEYRRARYRIVAIVPKGWNHVGLVAEKHEDGETWWYPNQPGYHVGADPDRPVWVDGAELKLLAAWGWKFVVAEALLFDARQRDPLGPFAGKLAEGRRAALEDRDLSPAVRELVAGAFRTVLLQTIGAFYTDRRRVTRYAPLSRSGRIPGSLCPVRLPIPGGEDVLMWSEWKDPKDPDLCHPEFAACIWRRNNVALLDGPGGTGALHYPFDRWRGFRTDSYWYEEDESLAPPAWPDDGRPGQFRPKGIIRGVLPEKWDEALALMEAA